MTKTKPVAIQITRPDGTTKVRTFDSRREAAKFGVSYFLTDNGYASRREAATVAAAYQQDGAATYKEFMFTEVPT
jgi:hypothetical protein